MNAQRAAHIARRLVSKTISEGRAEDARYYARDLVRYVRAIRCGHCDNCGRPLPVNAPRVKFGEERLCRVCYDDY